MFSFFPLPLYFPHLSIAPPSLPLPTTTGAAVASRQRREQEEEESRKRAKKLREESESSEGETSAPSSPSSVAALSLLRGKPPLSPSSPTYWGCPVCRKPHALLPTSEAGEKTVERWVWEGFLFLLFAARSFSSQLKKSSLFLFSSSFSFLLSTLHTGAPPRSAAALAAAA